MRPPEKIKLEFVYERLYYKCSKYLLIKLTSMFLNRSSRPSRIKNRQLGESRISFLKLLKSYSRMDVQICEFSCHSPPPNLITYDWEIIGLRISKARTREESDGWCSTSLFWSSLNLSEVFVTTSWDSFVLLLAPRVFRFSYLAVRQVASGVFGLSANALDCLLKSKWFY
jgi:hypothetical protein